MFTQKRKQGQGVLLLRRLGGQSGRGQGTYAFDMGNGERGGLREGEEEDGARYANKDKGRGFACSSYPNQMITIVPQLHCLFNELRVSIFNFNEISKKILNYIRNFFYCCFFAKSVI